jgi:hypothetical protein
MTDGDTHCVRRVRFRGRLANPRLARHRLEAALASGAGASRLGRESILCVRRLALPLRRVEKLGEALEAESFAAARPAREPVPANANAVLFADRAELLACLARDWCNGNATSLWWWPVLFPGDDFGAVVRRAWLQDARPVPAALDRLESARLAQQFLTRLAPGDVAALWRNIVQTFQLDTLKAAWTTNDLPGATPPATPRPSDPAPWSPWIDPPASLKKDAARVLITAILLERASGTIRSLAFAREVRQWRHQNEMRPALELASGKIIRSDEDDSKADPPENAPPAISSRSISGPAPSTEDRIPPAGPPMAESFASRKPSPPRPHRPRSPNSRTHENQSKRARDRKRDPITSPKVPTDACSRDAISAGPDSTALSTTRNDRSSFIRLEKRAATNVPARDSEEDIAGPSSAAPSHAPPLTPPPVAASPVGTWPTAAAPDAIETEWGGSLYLVNVAIALGFYGDFTTPAPTGLALSLWDFLALLGDRLIGEEFAQDPLSCLWARLSGRAENESPAAHFEPPAGEPLAIWLERTCRVLRKRITASLGLGDDCDLRRLVLNHHARIETGSTRLDAHFSLAKHPIELRLAGLDRDPGWVPAGGRSIYFHYD